MDKIENLFGEQLMHEFSLPEKENFQFCPVSSLNGKLWKCQCIT